MGTDGKGEGLRGDSCKRFRVRLCARKLVSGPRGLGQVGMTAWWVETDGKGEGMSGDSGKRFKVGRQRCLNSHCCVLCSGGILWSLLI